MFVSLSQIKGARLLASDGEVGNINEVYFEELSWVIRYLMVETAGWPMGGELLISPDLVLQPSDGGKTLRVALTRTQLRKASPIDVSKPTSFLQKTTQFPQATFRNCWHGDELQRLAQLGAVGPQSAAVDGEVQRAPSARKILVGGRHLRNSASMSGHDVQAADGSAGCVQGFLFCDESWSIRYLVVDTRYGWAGGREVLLETRWITSMDWENQRVVIALTREQMQDCPRYIEPDPLRQEARLRQQVCLGSCQR